MVSKSLDKIRKYGENIRKTEKWSFIKLTPGVNVIEKRKIVKSKTIHFTGCYKTIVKS